MADISVIIPCYNVENLIDRCLESLTRQTVGLDKMEIICVDDCSTDGTVARLQEWESRYPENIMVICCEVNARQGAARNIGLQYASGEWIAFVDSDDWVEPDYLEKMYTHAATGKYQVVCCGHGRDFSKELTFFTREPKQTMAEDVSGDKGNSPESVAGKGAAEVRKIFIKNDQDRKPYILSPALEYNGWAKLIRKSFLIENDLYFPENLTYEDACWGSLLHLYFTGACILPDKLYHYFVNDTSTVLKGNSNHHLDCLTIQTIAWEEYHSRGFMDRFREELEMEHIYSAYLAGMKMLILRFQVPDYNVYLLLRQLCLERIGNYKNNKYVKQGCLAELHLLMLTALDTPLSKAQFYEFAENIKKIGI